MVAMNEAKNRKLIYMPTPSFSKMYFIFILLLFALLGNTAYGAETVVPTLPPEFGQMIYRCNDARPDQLFIIGISHRDTITRLNGLKTARVQAEVYKLAEWLIQQRDLELLLPEGYFRSRPPEGKSRTAEVQKSTECPPSLDLNFLEKKLEDDTSFVNAEMLLLKNYRLRAQQVEDPFYYQEVGTHLRQLAQGTDSCDPHLLRSELDYLQARRTASMIQKIPGIISGDFEAGKIRTKRAIFTIGLSHLPQIMKYLEEKKITIPSPVGSSKPFADFTAEVNLWKENYSVFIILPKTLAEDPKSLKIIGPAAVLKKSPNRS
jgi:hypothetical protein